MKFIKFIKFHFLYQMQIETSGDVTKRVSTNLNKRMLQPSFNVETSPFIADDLLLRPFLDSL